MEESLTLMIDEDEFAISDNDGGGMQFVGMFPDFALGMPKDADEPRLDVLVRGDIFSESYKFRPMHPKRFEDTSWFIMVDEGVDEDMDDDMDEEDGDERRSSTNARGGKWVSDTDMRANMQIYHPKFGALDETGMSGALTVDIEGEEQTGTYTFGIGVTDFGAADSLTLTLDGEEDDPWTLVLVADDGHVMLFMDVHTHAFVIMSSDRWFLNDMSRMIPHYHPDHGDDGDSTGGETDGDMDGGHGGDGMEFEEDPELVAYFSDGKTMSQPFGDSEFEVLVFGDRSVDVFDARRQ